MYIVKYLELVHMAEMHWQARASAPYELLPKIIRYTFNNLYLSSFLTGVTKEYESNKYLQKKTDKLQNRLHTVI